MTELDKYKKALALAAKSFGEFWGDCPGGVYDVEPCDCAEECQSQTAECWQLYFLQKAEKESEPPEIIVNANK